MFTSLLIALTTVPVSTFQTAPFTCAYAHAAAEENLQRQCADMNMTLQSIQFGSCVPAGDDGGYVNYVGVDATGECSSPTAVN